jgi:hypothetical protein
LLVVDSTNVYLDILVVAELQQSVKEQTQNLRSLTKELLEFKSDYEARKKQDTYRFAEIAEVEDFKTNSANTTRIFITGELINQKP